MNELPTYGELIDLFEYVEEENPGDATLLVSKFNALYPNVTTGRPGRFFDTVQRLAIPTKPSIRGKSAKLEGSPKLQGSPLVSYCGRKRHLGRM